MNIFAERLKQLRKSKGMTQSDIGRVLGSTKSCIMKLEKGQNTTTLSNAILLSDVLGVSIDYLVGRTDNPEINK